MAILQSLSACVLRTWLRQLSHRRLPQTDGTLRLDGLHATVEIIRDRWGVPHIYASDTHDLLFAQGFVHAQDRLWQMDFQRRVAAGRLAEVLGPEVLPIDRWLRILSIRRVAERDVSLLGAELHTELEAYAAGVNAWIGRGSLPVEFSLLRYQPEPWTPADSASWEKMLSWGLSINWETELLRAHLIGRLGPELAAELEPGQLDRCPLIVTPEIDYVGIGQSALERAAAARPFTWPPADAGLGSNSWVLAGSRTTTGMPLLANDMHLPMGIPAVWYENHLAGGDLDVTGVTFPGIPGVVAGHNGHVAWGFTMGFADVQDLYMERLRRTDDGRVQYEYRGEWLDAETIRDEIRVKDGETVVEEVIYTRHGPIINALAPDFASEQPLALRWTSLEPDTAFYAQRAMLQAQDCAEFREALRLWSSPVLNVVYADTVGNIAYSFAGNVPVRARGDGCIPVPGWTDEYEWTGYIPFEELPHLYNPPQGYVATANNRVVGDDYPHFISREFATGDRAQRIVELIESLPAIDVPCIRRMQFDQVSPKARVVAGYLGALDVDDSALADIVEMVRKWDGTLGGTSAPAAVYEVFIQQMLKLMLAGKLQDLAPRYMGRGPTPAIAEGSLFGHRALEWLEIQLSRPDSHWFDLGHGETRDDVMRLALRETVAYLSKRFDGLQPEARDFSAWRWGTLHTLSYSHALESVPALATFFNRGPYPLGGDNTTVWATGPVVSDLAQQIVVGPPFRFIAELGNLGHSLGLLAPGQSGHPASPHYDDQVEAWFTGDYHPMLYAREDVEREAEGRLRLMPSERRDGF